MLPANVLTLDESELALMREIARAPIQTQRDLSRGTGLSLGMTNLLLKRLARKGLIKVGRLDWKRTQYLLTPKGALEKARKTFDYALYTVRLFRQLQENVETVLRREHADGRRAFWVVAQDELEGALRETVAELALPGARFSFARRFAEVPSDAELVLAATQEAAPALPSTRVLSLVDFLDADRRLK
jgi:DNA-binding MarR family transcriptional regulator